MIFTQMMAVAARIRKGLKELKRADGTPYVQLLDAGDTKCLPVVAPRVDRVCSMA